MDGEQESFPKLLELWVKGLDVDWNKLYGELKLAAYESAHVSVC